MLQYKRRIQYFPYWKMLCRKEETACLLFLEKGQKIDLTKGQPKVAKLQVGLGWDPIGQSGGFLSSLFGSKPNVDCDASVVMLEEDRF